MSVERDTLWSSTRVTVLSYGISSSSHLQWISSDDGCFWLVTYCDQHCWRLAKYPIVSLANWILRKGGQNWVYSFHVIHAKLRTSWYQDFSARYPHEICCYGDAEAPIFLLVMNELQLDCGLGPQLPNRSPLFRNENSEWSWSSVLVGSLYSLSFLVIDHMGLWKGQKSHTWWFLLFSLYQRIRSLNY